jgi:predicted ATP-dependent endonuclease of OLD family
MKIIKFQIKNYKSIIDSGECHLAELVTILAGKNESGKSSILEALYDFNVKQEINPKAIPIEDGSAKPEIKIWFKASKEQVEYALQEANIDYQEEISEFVDFSVLKKYPKQFTVSGNFLEYLPSDYGSDYLGIIQILYSKLDTNKFESVFKKLNLPLPELKIDDTKIFVFKKEFEDWKSSITPHLPSMDHLVAEGEIKNVLDEMSSELREVVIDSYEKSSVGRFNLQILKMCPNFILFDSFSDVFPNIIPFDQLDSSEWVSDLSAVSDLNINIIKSENERNKVTHKAQINLKLNKDFRQFWDQDQTNLTIDFDSQKLSFWIAENGRHYEPEIRSQGRRWHLAFYIKVSARARDDADNIILIDEPGLYLHANAQRDVLKNLEQCAANAPIVFSTHSPYLIEPDKLERIRLVQKNEERGTFIENKIHKVSDKETLTPILTAIGLELNRGIISVDKEKNVIVEGISDYYYLNAFLQIKAQENIHFIHGGSSGNMPKVGTILQGWGCKVLYLYDNDQAHKDAAKNIKAEWTVITKKMLLKIPVDGAIEDMFTPKDFADHVLGCDVTQLNVKNSVFVKDKDKALKAKEFREKIQSAALPSFDQQTLDNFDKLFEELDAAFAKI